MARTLFILTKDVWADLGVGPMVITVQRQGTGGVLQINQVQDDDTSLKITRNRLGDQISSTSTENISVKATDVGWAVVRDV